MMRKHVILFLLFLSWPVNNVHRLWNNCAPNKIYPFPADPDYWKDIQWYIHDIGEIICYIFIFMAIWLYINSHLKKDRDIRILFGAIFTNQLIDLPHYLISARHSEYILAAEGAILLYAALKILFNGRKGKSVG